MARGADFEQAILCKSSACFLLVPLFISALKRVDDLAIAMESRCYRGVRDEPACINLRLRLLIIMRLQPWH